MAFDRVELFLEVNLSLWKETGLRLHELADRLNCSYRIVEEAVITNTGMTFREFRMRKRIEKECYLLSIGFTKKEIAYELGYAHPNNWSRAKSRALGCDKRNSKKMIRV